MNTHPIRSCIYACDKALISVKNRLEMSRHWQRGMATAEYAVGILAAVALALVLFNVFNNNAFVTTMTKFVAQLIGKASQGIEGAEFKVFGN